MEEDTCRSMGHAPTRIGDVEAIGHDPVASVDGDPRAGTTTGRARWIRACPPSRRAKASSAVTAAGGSGRCPAEGITAITAPIAFTRAMWMPSARATAPAGAAG
jgi:hypothetical protein